MKVAVTAKMPSGIINAWPLLALRWGNNEQSLEM